MDLEKYEKEGFLVLKNVFNQDERELFVRGWQDLKSELQSGSSRVQRQARFVVGILPSPIGTIYKHSRLVEVANQLLGNDVALYYNRLLVKDEVWSGAVEAHQDMPYFHGSTTKLSVFVPLGPFNEATGGLKIAAASHKFGNMGIRGVIRLDEFPALPIASPSLEVGDVLLMNFLTWHYSVNPTVRAERPVLQIVYQPADDGSYFRDGLEGPTLVSGQWRTNRFLRFGDGIIPDTPAPAPPTHALPPSSAETGRSGISSLLKKLLKRKT